MDMTFQELGAKSPGGNSHMIIAPHVDAVTGQPKVVMVVKRDVGVVFETTLDGVPAFAVTLSQDSWGRAPAPGGEGNAPWELGHLLAQQWAIAEEMARNR
jgi:hypothetical protein